MLFSSDISSTAAGLQTIAYHIRDVTRTVDTSSYMNTVHKVADYIGSYAGPLIGMTQVQDPNRSPSQEMPNDPISIIADAPQAIDNNANESLTRKQATIARCLLQMSSTSWI